MTDAHGGGIGYEELSPGNYVRHSCDWNAAYTWCGKPMRSMRRADPQEMPSVQACAECARLEAAAKSRPGM